MSSDKIPLVNDPMLLNVLQLFKSESGVYLVTVHKRRMVKVQLVGKENLLGQASNQPNLSGSATSGEDQAGGLTSPASSRTF